MISCYFADQHYAQVAFIMIRCVSQLLLLLPLLTSSVRVSKLRPFMDPTARIPTSFGKQLTSTNAAASKSPTYSWTTKWYTSMPIDHFNYRNTDTFKLKYLTNYTYYQCGGPLFFYTGNEGSIENFADNTGIIWDLAPLFNAAVVFAEHRYYGESMPFGNQSYTNVTKLGYLSAVQALADFAQLIPYLKSNSSELGSFSCSADTNIPVIAFGGSYGGMLTAWFRMKYPHIVDGAWSSSAPLRYFEGTGVPPYRADNITTRTFVDSGCARAAFSNGFNAVYNMSLTEEGRTQLNQIFKAQPNYEMKSADDFWSLYNYMDTAIFYMAMTDYPYQADFLEDMPAFPVEYGCQYAKTVPSNGRELAQQLYDVINVYYNYSGTLQYNCFTSDCPDTSMGVLDADLGWPWQTCTSLTLLTCDMGGDNDFFLNNCNVTGGLVNSEIQDCIDTFGQGASPDIGYVSGLYHLDAVPIRYGITYSAASNTIFTNGYLDPWSGGGVYADSPGIKHAMKNGVYVFYMKDAAHHLDLRTPNSCDPPSVTNARFQIVNILKCWVNSSCTTPPAAEPLPDNSGWTPPSSCSYVTHGYPWGQNEIKLRLMQSKKMSGYWSPLQLLVDIPISSSRLLRSSSLVVLASLLLSTHCVKLVV